MCYSTQRKLQALILGATGLFLLQKIWSGNLFWYINSRFMILTLLAAIGLLILTQALILNLTEQRSADQWTPNDNQVHNEVQEHLHDHNAQSHTNRRLPWGLIVVALPVLLGILIPARPLGASAVPTKGLRTSVALNRRTQNTQMLLDIPANNRTILDWLQLVNNTSDPSLLAGETADVVGFVFRDPRNGDNQFMVGRFAITCCVADAFAIGMTVDWPQAHTLAANTWVRVKGKLSIIDIDGNSQPLIQAEIVQQVSAPDQPYLFP